MSAPPLFDLAPPPLSPPEPAKSSTFSSTRTTMGNFTGPMSIDEKGKFDELVEDKGVKILIEPKALMHVVGTKMDFIDDKLRSEFIFVNPNCKSEAAK